MASFGRQSQKHRKTLHPDLQTVLDEAIKIYDFSITCGHRGKDAQNKAFADDKSTKQWPDSKHNKFPSDAVDLCPYPVDWENRDRFIFLIGIIYCIAKQKSIKIRSGGNWKGDWQFGKQKFDDLVHFELIQNIK